MEKIYTFLQKRKGQAALEAVVVLFVLVIFIGIMITSFQIIYNKLVMNYAAFVCAREASFYKEGVGYDQASAKAKAWSILQLFIKKDDLSSFNVSVNTQEDYATCSISGQINYLWNIVTSSGKSKSKAVQTSITIIKEKPLNTSSQTTIGGNP